MVKLPDDLHLAVPRMDREHAEVLKAAAELRSVLDSSFPNASLAERLLGGFAEIVSAHFASEEELMQSRGYQGWRGHAAEHRRLMAQLNSIRTGLVTGAINPCGALALFVDVWTAQHIQGPDRQVAEYLRSEQPVSFPSPC